MIIESKSKILVIYTGGTIGMILDKASGTLNPLKFEDMSKFIPEFNECDYALDYISFDPTVDSSNMNPELWVKLASIIEENYESFDGFVVLHGSDTMAYSASALSFMLENLNKPVIFTGSQLPLGVNRTDGKENFITAVEIAAQKADDTPIVPEVCIYFENELYRGNRTFKYNAENFDAFRSVNYPVLADVGVYIKYNDNAIRKPNFKNLKVHKKLDTSIVILKLFPGISTATVKSILGIGGLRAVVMETYGTGNTHTDPAFIETIKAAISNGLFILNISQCKGGAVEHGKYQASVPLAKAGVISGLDMTLESAVTKLMFLLGQGYSGGKLATAMQTSLRGELTA
ncbi:MAG TPA: type I asparaginase [Bacteroidales bacterium]|nr:type I asparaginase [Bacteroidales bacterium]